MSPGYGRLPPQPKRTLTLLTTLLQHLNTSTLHCTLACSWWQHQGRWVCCTEFWSISDDCTLWLKVEHGAEHYISISTTPPPPPHPQCKCIQYCALSSDQWRRVYCDDNLAARVECSRLGWGTIRAAPIRGGSTSFSTNTSTLLHQHFNTLCIVFTYFVTLQICTEQMNIILYPNFTLHRSITLYWILLLYYLWNDHKMSNTINYQATLSSHH